MDVLPFNHYVSFYVFASLLNFPKLNLDFNACLFTFLTEKTPEFLSSRIAGVNNARTMAFYGDAALMT